MSNLSFFQDSDGSWSMSRLCMFVATLGAVFVGFREVAYIKDMSIWTAALIPFSIMLGGCLPYIFNRINETKEKILDNPKLIEQLTGLIKGIKNA